MRRRFLCRENAATDRSMRGDRPFRVRWIPRLGGIALALVLALDSGVARMAPGVIPTPGMRTLTPAGTMVSAGDFPAAAALTPGGTLLVADAGETVNYLDAFDTATMAATFVTPTSSSGTGNNPAAQSGRLALSPDGRTVYSGGGTTGTIRAFSANATPAQMATYTVGNLYVGAVAVGANGRYLYAAEPFDPGRPFGKGNTLARVDTSAGTVVTATVGAHPDALADGVLPRGRRAVVAVANRDDGAVSILDAATLAPIALVAAGRQPAALAFTGDGSHLLVVDSLDDELVDIQTSSWRVDARLSLSGPRGIGAGPSALAVTRDGGTVYVALSSDNAVAVVQRLPVGRAAERPASLRLLGRIPTAEYPTAVAIDADKRLLYVTAGKGIYAAQGDPPVPGVPVQNAPPPTVTGPSGLGVSGVVESIPLPATRARLDAYSAQVSADNAWSGQPAIAPAIPSAITHVVYIIRENKTYDEEFGDEPGGSPAGLLYGRQITPNTHALAERFGLLQAYYDNEEVSDTGHQVVMGSVPNDWVERVTQQAYGADGAPNQDSEDGKVDDTLWAPANYLLDDALAHAISFKDYGEFYRQSQVPSGPGPSPALEFRQAVTPALDAHIAHGFPGFGFDLNTPDTTRAAYWVNDFNKDVANNTFPALEVIYLPTDHTLGPGTPQQEVANNDLATGQILDALSHSSYWGSTAVFLTEDDPQSGIDHIDEHRSLGVVISPWVKEGAVTARYDQTGMLRTIERILGLPPLTEFDAVATPMDALFNQTTPDLTPYSAITPTVPTVPAATLTAYHRLERRLLGAHPRPDRVSSWDQLQLQWLAVRGRPFPLPAWVRWYRQHHAAVARPRARPPGYLWAALGSHRHR